MASYYKAAERSLTRNCSADWIAVTKFVDDTLMNGTEEEQIDLKTKLWSARESGPGQAVNVPRGVAEGLSNIQAAGVLMDPLSFYQVSQKPSIPLI